MFLWKSKKMNYEARRNGVKPSIILMHYTGMQSMEEAIDRLSDPESKVSAHHLVDEDGTVYDLVPEDQRAWHAGVSYWGGEDDINSHSIGIEIVNPGHEWGYRPFPQEQMEAVMYLSQDIMSRYDIKHVLAHSDVAPERKIDPGELFDWRYLNENGVGLWPDPTDEDHALSEKIFVNDYEVERVFKIYGYNGRAAFVDVISAFHRHYYPERFAEGKHEELCEESVARLISLVRLSGKKLDF